ncbi:MAG TPA: VWA domain-containing protein [Thermoanaerobaculia bacterium]|nr:VWA domain-containing protein [Thermoanaerobaculia bacterium]
MRGRALALVAFAPLFVHGADDPSRQGSLATGVRVERVVVDAYVTDRRGDPIPNLTAADFRVKADGKLVSLEAADWIPADKPEVEPMMAVPPPEGVGENGGPSSAATVPEAPPGRLLVFFFQTDFTRQRAKGQMQMANEAHRLLDRLLPSDRVAVLSFDSHLHLHLDFTNDREAIQHAVFDSLRIGEMPMRCAGTSPSLPSIAARFDFAAAKKAYDVERGLEVLAEALKGIPSAKSLLYFGWGFRVDGSPREDTHLREALAAMAEARMAVFTIDVTWADYHTLESELIQVAELTGGSHHTTFRLPLAALDAVGRALGGRYVLVFVKPDGPPGVHEIDVDLVGRKGTVTARPFYLD